MLGTYPDGRPALRFVPGGRRDNLTGLAAAIVAAGRAERRRELVELIVRYRSEGATWAQVGRRLGYHPGHLRKLAKGAQDRPTDAHSPPVARSGRRAA